MFRYPTLLTRRYSLSSCQSVSTITPPRVHGEAVVSNPWFKPSNQVFDSHSIGTHKQDGWILQKGMVPIVRVAPLVISEGRKSLTNSLVGFLVSPAKGLSQLLPWLEARWGKLPYKIKMLDSFVWF